MNLTALVILGLVVMNFSKVYQSYHSTNRQGAGMCGSGSGSGLVRGRGPTHHVAKIDFKPLKYNPGITVAVQCLDGMTDCHNQPSFSLHSSPRRVRPPTIVRGNVDNCLGKPTSYHKAIKSRNSLSTHYRETTAYLGLHQ